MIYYILITILILLSIIGFYYMNKHILPLYFKIDKISDEYIENFINK